MYNISFIDFRVTDEPVEGDETWTRTMYICLFVGGFWCGAVTFVMLLAIHNYCEQFRTRQRRGPVTTMPHLWADWRSSIASRLTSRDWAATDEEATSNSSADSLYAEVAGQAYDTEYIEAVNWEHDAQAIHFWRPFEDHPLPKTFSCCESGKCLDTNYKDPEGSK